MQKKCKPDWLALSILILLILGLSAIGEAQGPAEGRWEVFAGRLGSQVPEWMEAYRVPGAAVALVQDGRVAWVQGFGYADRERGVPVGPDTVFQVGSVSKSLTAWGVIHLVEEGRIDLDAPAERYLSRWHFPPSRFDSRQVTIRRLLSHTAGLSIPSYMGTSPEKPIPSVVESLSGHGGGAGEVRIVAAPGEHFRYSGGGYSLLQQVVEEVSGEPFADFMMQRILGPLGMTRSGFDWTDALRPLTAAAYDYNEKRVPNRLFAEKAAAGLYTTAADLAKFVAAAMPGPGREPAGRGVVSAAGLDRMIAPVGPMPLPPLGRLEDSVGYGLGFIIENLPAGFHAAGHGGSNLGWRAQFIFVHEKKSGLVVLTNSANGVYVIYEALRAWGNWLGTGPPAFSRLAERLHRVTAAGASGLIAAVAVWIGWKAFFRRPGSRKKGRPLAAGAPPPGRGWLRGGAWIALAVLMPAVWFLRIKPFLEGFVAPGVTRWASLAVLFLAAAFLAEVVWPGCGRRDSSGGSR